MDLHEADPKRFPDCFNSMSRRWPIAYPEVLGKHYEITFPGRQWASGRNLRKTPLHERWLAEGAHFGQFYGYERPLYFGKKHEPVLTFGRPDWHDQVGAEVAQAHEGAAIFDQSTFGKIRVSGPDAETFLNRVCANDMSRPAGRAIYTAMLNQHGGIESDLTALRLSEDDYRLYVGTTAIRRDLAWLRRHLEDGEDVSIANETDDYAVLGLMGPQAADIASAVSADALNALGYFRHTETQIAGVAARAVRLSYVGEAGWEITCPAGEAHRVYDALYGAGARPAGLFAQTSMRIEKRFLAYGHDIDTDCTPLEAGLEFAVSWDKDFIGRDALLKKRKGALAHRMVTVVLDDENAVPLGNEPVYLGNEIIGKTTSAAFGYRVGKPVALAFIECEVSDGDDPLSIDVDIAGHRTAGSVLREPAFDPKGARMRSSR